MSTLNEAGSIAPSLLVAMPQLLDPNFSRAVVLLCEHRDEGAMGLILNRPDPECRTASQVVQLEEELRSDNGLPVWEGGPVDQSRGWLLLGESNGDGVEVVSGLYLSASRDLLRKMIESPARPDRCRFLIGYAGWGPRQLDGELAASAWLNVPIAADLIFDTPPELLWETTIRRLGIEPYALSIGPGVH